MEWFMYPCIIFCMSIWETDHDNIKGGWDLEGDWIKVLFVTFKMVRSNFFTTSGAKLQLVASPIHYNM